MDSFLSSGQWLRESLEAEKTDLEKFRRELPASAHAFLGTASGCGDAPFSKRTLPKMGPAQSTGHQTFKALEEKGKIVKIASLSGNSYSVPNSIDRLCFQILGGQSKKDMIATLVLVVIEEK